MPIYIENKFYLFRLYVKNDSDEDIKIKEIHINNESVYFIFIERGKYKMIRKTIEKLIEFSSMNVPLFDK